MLVELFENEYNYIIRCVKELLSKYYDEAISTLHIDDFMHKIDPHQNPIYSFQLNLNLEDIDKIRRIEKRLKKPKNVKEFELYDDYADFFRFIEMCATKL